MIIRKATIEDLGKIAELFGEYGHYENDLDRNVKASSINEIKKSERNYFELGTIYFIIEEKGGILGCLNVNIDKRGKEKVGVLHTLIITKEARGKGYGSKIVKYAFDYFKKKGCRRAKTFVHFANKNAQKFWKGKGFELEHGYNGVKKLK